MENQEQEETKTFTVAEVADRFQLHHRTVRNWIRDGTLGHIKMGEKNIRITQQHIDQFIKDNNK